MSSTTLVERDALLEAGVGNLGLLVREGHVSGILAGQIALALIQADDRADLAAMRAIEREVERAVRMFGLVTTATRRAGDGAASMLTPEAGTLGRLFAVTTLRAILARRHA